MVDSEDGSVYSLAVRIFSLCFLWYALSIAGNVVVKTLLTDFPYPMTVTMVQLLCIWVYLKPVIRIWNIPPLDITRTTWRYYFTMIYPLAFAKFITSVSAHVSLWKVTVSYSHTVKATMPLFTIVLSRLLFGETHSLQVYVSVLPIVLGVCVASATETSFDTAGLISALIATLGFSLLNIYTKKVLDLIFLWCNLTLIIICQSVCCWTSLCLHHGSCYMRSSLALCLLDYHFKTDASYAIYFWKCMHALKDTGMHHLQMLLIISRVTFVLFVPIWMYVDLLRIIEDDVVMQREKVIWSIGLLLFDAFSNFAVNVVAFTILAYITPLSYAVANASKRLFIIGGSLILLKNPVTSLNMFGMFLAVLGVLLYNKAKYDQNKRMERETILPLVKSDTNLYKNSLSRTNFDNGYPSLHKNYTESDFSNHFTLTSAPDLLYEETQRHPYQSKSTPMRSLFS